MAELITREWINGHKNGQGFKFWPKMEDNIKENGKMIKKMERESLIFLMVTHKVIG